MPHFKCTACKTRLCDATAPADRAGDLCPGCGALLEPVGDLCEVVGFRSIRSHRHTAAGDPDARREQTAERIEDFVARRQLTLTRARLDAGRRNDDGDSFRPQAVPLPRPETNL